MFRHKNNTCFIVTIQKGNLIKYERYDTMSINKIDRHCKKEK